MRMLRRLPAAALLLTVWLMIGCTAPANSYRKAYGPGPWDWEVQHNYLYDEGLYSQRPVYAQYDSNYRRAYRDAHMDVGRPDAQLKINPPDQRDLDLIPDTPTVMEPH